MKEKKNLKYLIKYNGNVEQVSKEFQARKDKKE
jgi:hypothetical protein